MRIRNLAAAALLGAAAVGLSGCTTGLPAKVTRYSAMPIPQGQTFHVVPGEGVNGGLESASSRQSWQGSSKQKAIGRQLLRRPPTCWSG